MVRNRPFLIFASTLLLFALTLADTKFFYLEQEELVENREVENEEVNESEASKGWFKVQLSGGGDFFAEQRQLTNHYSGYVITLNAVLAQIDLITKSTPLFIKYCSLKIHLK